MGLTFNLSLGPRLTLGVRVKFEDTTCTLKVRRSCEAHIFLEVASGVSHPQIHPRSESIDFKKEYAIMLRWKWVLTLWTRLDSAPGKRDIYQNAQVLASVSR